MKDTRLRRALVDAGMIYVYSDGSVQYESGHTVHRMKDEIYFLKTRVQALEESHKKQLDALMDHLGVEYVHEPARSVVRVKVKE